MQKSKHTDPDNIRKSACVNNRCSYEGVWPRGPQWGWAGRCVALQHGRPWSPLARAAEQTAGPFQQEEGRGQPSHRVWTGTPQSVFGAIRRGARVRSPFSGPLLCSVNAPAINTPHQSDYPTVQTRVLQPSAATVQAVCLAPRRAAVPPGQLRGSTTLPPLSVLHWAPGPGQVSMCNEGLD